MAANQSENNEDKKVEKNNQGSAWYITALKIIGWTVAGFLALAILTSTLIVWILTPQKLTPIVQRQANKYLNADVAIEKVELTFWHTFPKMTIDVDRLQIVNASLADSVVSKYPGCDSIAGIDKFHGGINLAKLLIGEIALYDVEFNNVFLNLVEFGDSLSNYDIVPPGGETSSSEEASILDISINSFSITNASPIRFRSVPDSIDVSLALKKISFLGKNAPLYSLLIEARGESELLAMLNKKSVDATVNGEIKWNRKEPMAIGLQNFAIGIDSLSAKFSTSLDFEKELTVESFSFDINKWKVENLLSVFSDSVLGDLSKLETNMVFSAKGILTKPFVPADTTVKLPSAFVELEIMPSWVKWNKIELSKVEMTASVDFNGVNPDSSMVDVEKFAIEGKSVSISGKANLGNLITDTHIIANINAKLNLDALPKILWKDYAALMSGRVRADLGVDLRVGDLKPSRFHRVVMLGDIDLDEFRYLSVDSITSCYVGSSCLEFGTGSRYKGSAGVLVDSLLTASLKIDTVYVGNGPVEIAGKDLSGGVGTRITREKLDSTTIVPIGGVVRIKRVNVVDKTDSLRIRLSDVNCNASLKRFDGDRHAPQLSLVFDAGRIFARQSKNVVTLSTGHADLSMHLRKSNAGTTRRNNIDSIRGRRIATETNVENNLDLEVDSGLKALFQKWNAGGHFTAERGSFRTPSLPVKNILRNIDLSFSTDSVVLTDLYYKMGNSDFIVNGTVSNIRRALTRNRNNTLSIDFNVESDSIDVNQLSGIFLKPVAAISGNSYDEEDDDLLEIESDSAEIKPLLVPSNIAATFKMNARNVLYTDILFHDLRGMVLVMNNAINLRNLRARTDIGSIDLNALYSAPSAERIEFGTGMKIDNFHIDKLTSLVPAIDTLLPMLKDLRGIINADIAATSRIDSTMDFELPSLRAAIRISGDSLVLLNDATFRSLSKWLMFKNKKKNMIDHMSVEIVVEDNKLEIFPFMFDIDRYRLGVMGSNDLDMNLNYHVSVLKSPLPFKFGINIKGNVDNMKIRLGGAKFKDNMVGQTVSIADTTRINLVNQIEDVFRRSAASRLSLNKIGRKVDMEISDVISHSDSVLMIKEGLIEAPVIDSVAVAPVKAESRKKK